MDLLPYREALFFRALFQCQSLRENPSADQSHYLGERGEVLLPLLFALLTSSFLLAGQLWINQTYEKKTKEHLDEFRKDWQKLEARYK